MMDLKNKLEDFNGKLDKTHYAVGLIALAILAGGAYSLTSTDGAQSDPTSSNSDWQEAELTDISTDEQYTVSDLEKPVLVETFAVWCSTCTNQQNELKKYHEESGVESVALNVDPNEDEQKVQQHIDRYGFDWRYSISSSNLTRQLINEYGNSIATPPLAPMILVCENGTRRLPNGVKPVSQLEEEVDKGC